MFLSIKAWKHFLVGTQNDPENEHNMGPLIWYSISTIFFFKCTDEVHKWKIILNFSQHSLYICISARLLYFIGAVCWYFCFLVSHCRSTTPIQEKKVGKLWFFSVYVLQASYSYEFVFTKNNKMYPSFYSIQLNIGWKWFANDCICFFILLPTFL